MVERTETQRAVEALLRQSGWEPSDRLQVHTHLPADHPQPTSHPWPNRVSESRGEYRVQSPKPETLGADYVLLDPQGQPLAIVEVKKPGQSPQRVKHQTLPAAQALGAPFIFLTNGQLIYFWDYQKDDARVVPTFFSQAALQGLARRSMARQSLGALPLPEYYQRRGEMRVVREGQREAMRSLDSALDGGKRRILLSLPAGLGKTDLLGLSLQRLRLAGWGDRALVVVSHELLVPPMLETLQDLGHDCTGLQPGVTRESQPITVSSLPTLARRYQEFTSLDFEIVIADDYFNPAISWTQIIGYFEAIQIGLTALAASDLSPQLFEFYHCSQSQSDFSYSLDDALSAGDLVPTQIVSEIRPISQLNSDSPSDFEEFNRAIVTEFERYAWANYRKLAPGQRIGPGKAIALTQTKHQAYVIAQLLNDFYPELQGQYAQAINQDIGNTQEIINQFKTELYPQILVTPNLEVLDLDYPELLHLVICDEISEQATYQGLIKRGMRTAPHISKQAVAIYDFFTKLESDRPSSLPLNFIEIGLEGKLIAKSEYISCWKNWVRDRVATDSTLQKVRDSVLLTSYEAQQFLETIRASKFYFNAANLRKAYDDPDLTKSIFDYVRVALGQESIQNQSPSLEENLKLWISSRRLSPEQAQFLKMIANWGMVQRKVAIADLTKPPWSILNAEKIGIQLFGRQGLEGILRELNQILVND